MFVKINGLRINYIVEGKGKDILLLHGWGGCIDSWYPITQNLKQKYKVWVMDLPGFGKSDTPNPPFDYYSYADLVGGFIRQNQIQKPVLIGHSFGGSISAGVASRYPELTEKIILVNSSGIRIKNLRLTLFGILAEAGKNFFRIPIISQFYKGARYLFYKAIKEEDYLKAGKLKAVFSAVVKQDIQHLLPNISCPTLIFWGEKDKPTPLSHAKIFNTLIPYSKLITIPNAGHFAYLEYPERFCEEVEKFIENK